MADYRYNEDLPFWKKSFVVEVIRIVDIFDEGTEFRLDLVTSEENRGLGRAVDIVCENCFFN